MELEYFGVKGYGEAPAIQYYDITTDKMIADIERKKIFLEKFSFSDPERYWHYLHHLFPANPFLVAALDIAGWDLYGKLRRKPVYELFGADITKAPITDYTIGIDTIEKMVEKMKQFPHPIYKIKVGFENDVETIKALRQHTDAIFRVDANAAWTTEEALNKIPQLKALGVELIEQPLAKDNWEGMKQLFEQNELPLFADESCVFEGDVEKCVGYFHGINIKFTKCSGMTPARRMITKARELRLKVMLGCMNETSVGTGAMAQLAPFVDYLDMDGTLLQSEAVGHTYSLQGGSIQYDANPGNGVSVENF